MSDIINIENLQEMIIEIREQSVLLDSDVARIYKVETRDINKAVSSNPEKFPEGYLFQLSKPEKQELVKNFHRFENLKHSIVNTKGILRKGLCLCNAVPVSRSVAPRQVIGAFKVRPTNTNLASTWQ